MKVDVADCMDDIRKAKIFSSLKEESIDRLLSLAKKKNFEIDDLIIEKGQVHDFFVILLKGGFDIVDQLSDRNYVVASLTKPGEFVGGQSLLERPASMNVRVSCNTECLFFYLDEIKEFQDIADALIVASAVDTAQKLESTNVTLLQQLEKASTASSTILLCLSGFSLAMIFLSFMTSINYPTDGLWSWLFILFVIPPPLIFIASTRQPLTVFGVTWDQFGKSFLDGLIGSCSIILLTLIAICFLNYPKGVDLSDLINGLKLGHLQTYLYLFHCYLQEFFVRGSIQTSLEEVIQLQWRKPLAIVLASAIFSVLHYPLGFNPIVATFLSGLLFGFVYSRTKNLIGVTLIHYVSGKIFFSLYYALT